MDRKMQTLTGGTVSAAARGDSDLSVTVPHDKVKTGTSQVPSFDSDEMMIVDAGDLRRYRIEIPNLIDDLELDPYEFRLYVHLKRVAGATPGGSCWQSTRTLSDRCGMSLGAISKAKRSLADRGLIQVGQVKRSRDGKTVDSVTIVDIWPLNTYLFGNFRGDDLGQRIAALGGCVHQVNAIVHHMNEVRSPGETEEVTIQQESTYPGRNPSSSGADVVDRTPAPEPHNDDDDGFPPGGQIEFSDPDPEPGTVLDDVVDLVDDPVAGDIVQDDDDDLAERAALLLLRRVAPNHDRPVPLVREHGADVVGIVCAGLLADPDRLKRWRNPAAAIDTIIRGGAQDPGAADIWRIVLDDLRDGVEPRMDSYRMLSLKWGAHERQAQPMERLLVDWLADDHEQDIVDPGIDLEALERERQAEQERQQRDWEAEQERIQAARQRQAELAEQQRQAELAAEQERRRLEHEQRLATDSAYLWRHMADNLRTQVDGFGTGVGMLRVWRLDDGILTLSAGTQDIMDQVQQVHDAIDETALAYGVQVQVGLLDDLRGGLRLGATSRKDVTHERTPSLAPAGSGS